VKIQVVVLWVVTSCSIAVGYQRFEGPCCLHLHGEVRGVNTASQPSRSGLEISISLFL